MMNILASETGFIVLFFLFAVGAAGSLLLSGNDKLANACASCFSIAGSIWGIAVSVAVLATNSVVNFTVGQTFWPLLSFNFDVTKLSAFFVFTIALISLFCSIYGIGYIKHYYRKYSIGALGFFYNLFIAGMILTVTANNALLFLIFWEIMSFASYFLVVYERDEEQNISAGFIYLVMTHIGTLFIIAAFLLIFKYTNSFDFSVMKQSAELLPLSVKNAAFVLMLIGFGTKAGIIPFHIWLPKAHPAAPSHVSALMSGVMIKTGVYMLIKFFLVVLQPVPLWWGLTVLTIGAISSLLGVLYALTEHDLKRLLAYSSIENIGIILLGVGSALVFSALAMPELVILSLVAALFHIFNHATFKALLFLSAGSVISQTHTRNMEKFGGLIRYMPQTAFCFLIGSMAISALPPFNGFFSEWLIFQTLFKGIFLMDFWTKWFFIFAAGSLAFTGGLALACFVKAFGSTFLARPRSAVVALSRESTFALLIAMFLLALLALLFGVFSGWITSVLKYISTGMIYRADAVVAGSAYGNSFVVGNGSDSVSAIAILFGVGLAVVFVIIAARFVINRKQKEVIGETWNCGSALLPRTQINAAGFSRSIVLIFKGLLKPSMQHDVEYLDAQSRYLPSSRAVSVGISDVYDIYFYKPLYGILTSLSVYSKAIQSGNINVYILYILIALTLALLVVV
ncbi:MAG: proton-conducting transporter membrane subunit [Negativicutes bacterium]|jgi:hydrogenase-4 component B